MNNPVGIDLDMLQKRAKLLSDIRAFFASRGVLEVQTPLLSQYGGTDVHIQSLMAHYNQSIGYLHTSPEFAMKKLLAVHPISMYQICPVFRDYERGARHNIEFTMLEWYRPHQSLEALIDELCALIECVSLRPFCANKISYRHLFRQYLDIDPFYASITTLQQLANAHNLPKSSDKQELLDALFSFIIEPNLGKDAPVLVVDYPAQTAALAKVSKDKDGYDVAKRFECYINGLEIANAYDELLDADALRARFEADNEQRQKNGLPTMPIDEDLLAACDKIPPCSGIALGIDRLLMALYDAPIDKVLTITCDKA